MDMKTMTEPLTALERQVRDESLRLRDEAEWQAAKIAHLEAELKATRAIVDEAQVVANCFNGDVLTKSGVEFAQALDNLRTALAAYVDHE